MGHRSLAAQLKEIFTADDFHTDEPLLHIRVNLASCYESGIPLTACPSADFVLTGREEAD